MSKPCAALAALALLALAGPTIAQEPSAETTAPASCTAKPARKGPGLGGLLAAANRAGAGELLSGRSGQIFGSGNRGAIAGAVLGSALGAADADAASGGYGGSGLTSAGGGRKARIAAVAAGTVIELARSQAAASPACASN